MVCEQQQVAGQRPAGRPSQAPLVRERGLPLGLHVQGRGGRLITLYGSTCMPGSHDGDLRAENRPSHSDKTRAHSA